MACIQYARFLNAVSLARQPSPIRVLTAIAARSGPGMISLAGGLPNPDMFPFKEAEVTLKDGNKLFVDESKMKKALQYGPTQGDPELINFVKELQKKYHCPPTWGKPLNEGGFDLCVTTGAQNGLCMAFEAMINPGDKVLIESPTYSGTIAILRPLGADLLPVETDHHGMKPDALRNALAPWTAKDSKNPNSDIPKLLYTIPNGCNPTGASLTTSRKQEIYAIAKEYNLLIIEDDPYYFLQFTTKDRSPSFLSLDTDGRVLRCDSFSKVLSSGLRLGVVSGPQPIIERLVLHLQVSILHTSLLAQVMAGQLLNMWGLDGFAEHIDKVVAFYQSQKEQMISAAEKHLHGLAEWQEPVAGMFLWLKLKGIEDTQELIEEKAQKKEVLLVPGHAFMPDNTKPSPCVRASFSIATADQMDKAFERLASLIREELK